MFWSVSDGALLMTIPVDSAIDPKYEWGISGTGAFRVAGVENIVFTGDSQLVIANSTGHIATFSVSLNKERPPTWRLRGWVKEDGVATLVPLGQSTVLTTPWRVCGGSHPRSEAHK